MRALAASMILLALSACAPLNSVYWSEGGPGQSRVISTDAYQRHVIMTADGQGKMRACSEASPDAMAVFSSALTARGPLGPTNAQADAALAIGQTAATIERTQTINMLRELMFRTCELWLSDAIGKNEFLIRSARDHRSMIAILSVEQLTGVVKPPSTIISGPAVTALAAQGEKVAELLLIYGKEREAAVTARTAAATAFNDLNTEHDDGNGGKKKLCDLTAAPAGTEANFAKCAKLKADRDNTAAIAEAAIDRENKVLDQLKALSGGLAAGVSGGTSNAGGVQGGVSRMSDAQLTTLAGTVERIAASMVYDETLVFCESYLFRPASEMTDEVVRLCTQVLAERFINDEKARGGLLRFDAAGTSVTLSDYSDPAPGDTATPILRAYLEAVGASDEEQARRLQLAGNHAVQLGLIVSRDEIVNLTTSDYLSATNARLLLNRLRQVDQTEAGRAALADR